MFNFWEASAKLLMHNVRHQTVITEIERAKRFTVHSDIDVGNEVVVVQLLTC